LYEGQSIHIQGRSLLTDRRTGSGGGVCSLMGVLSTCVRSHAFFHDNGGWCVTACYRQTILMALVMYTAVA